MLRRLLLTVTILISTIFASNIVEAPDNFKLKTIDGSTIEATGKKSGLDIPEAKGQIVLIEFWGTHCPPCLFSIPHYIDLTKEYKGKVKMYAIEVQGTPKESLKKFVKAKGINYSIFTQSENRDFVNYLAYRSGWRGAIPFLMIFDKDGNFITRKRGMVSEEYIKQIINYLLNPPKKTLNKSSEQNRTKEQNITKKDANSSSSK